MFFDTGPKPPNRELDPNATKKFHLYCELCGYKHWVDNEQEINLMPLQSAPVYTGVNKSREQTKRFKCPCGRGALKMKTFVQPPLPKDNIFLKGPDNNNEGSKQTQIGF